MTASAAINPFAAAQRRTRWLSWFAAPMIGAMAFWALRPIEVASVAPPSIDPPAVGDNEPRNALASIHPGVFAVNLWNVPPKPPAPDKVIVQAPSPPPLNLSLIGIIHEQGHDRAVLYDPDNDRLMIVADGETVRDHTVRIVGGAMGVVELSNGLATRRLLLRPDKEASPS